MEEVRVRADVSASRKLAGCPATFPQEDGCPATRTPELSCSARTEPHPCARRAWAQPQLLRECRLSALGSRARDGENTFRAIFVKSVNSVECIALVWEQVL